MKRARRTPPPALCAPSQVQPRPWIILYDQWAFLDLRGEGKPRRSCPLSRIWTVRPNRLEPGCNDDAPAPCPANYEVVVPVYSCWNGIAAFDAEVFRRGIRFRWVDGIRASADECPTLSEQLVCKDMWSIGLGKVVMDTGVQVAYHDVVHSKRLRKFSSELAAIPPKLEGFDKVRPPKTWHCRGLPLPGVFAPAKEPLELRLHNKREKLGYSADWRTWPPVVRAMALRNKKESTTREQIEIA